MGVSGRNRLVLSGTGGRIAALRGTAEYAASGRKSLSGSLRVPFFSLCCVLFRAYAALVAGAHEEFGLAKSLLRRLQRPGEGELRIGVDDLPFVQHERQVVLGFSVARVGGALHPVESLGIALHGAVACPAGKGKKFHAFDGAALSGLTVPFGRSHGIGIDAEAVFIKAPQEHGRTGVSFIGQGFHDIKSAFVLTDIVSGHSFLHGGTVIRSSGGRNSLRQSQGEQNGGRNRNTFHGKSLLREKNTLSRGRKSGEKRYSLPGILPVAGTEELMAEYKNSGPSRQP